MTYVHVLNHVHNFKAGLHTVIGNVIFNWFNNFNQLIAKTMLKRITHDKNLSNWNPLSFYFWQAVQSRDCWVISLILLYSSVNNLAHESQFIFNIWVFQLDKKKAIGDLTLPSHFHYVFSLINSLDPPDYIPSFNYQLFFRCSHINSLNAFMSMRFYILVFNSCRYLPFPGWALKTGE